MMGNWILKSSVPEMLEEGKESTMFVVLILPTHWSRFLSVIGPFESRLKAYNWINEHLDDYKDNEMMVRLVHKP